MKKNFKLLNEKTIHKHVISSIITLNNGKIATTSYDKTLKIFDINLNLLNSFQIGKDPLYYITQIHSNECIISSYNIIYIILIKENKYDLIQMINKQVGINKIIELKNFKLISCYNTFVLKIWYRNKNNLFDCECIISSFKGIKNIFLINDNCFVSTSNLEGLITFFNTITYENKIIQYVNLIDYHNTIVLLDQNILGICCGYYKPSIYLININKTKIFKEIDLNEKLSSILKLNNNNFILCGKGVLIYCKYNNNNNEFIKIAKQIDVGKTFINLITKINNNTFAIVKNDITLQIINI
jgi:hypothetical protein